MNMLPSNLQITVITYVATDNLSAKKNNQEIAGLKIKVNNQANQLSKWTLTYKSVVTFKLSF